MGEYHRVGKGKPQNAAPPGSKYLGRNFDPNFKGGRGKGEGKGKSEQQKAYKGEIRKKEDFHPKNIKPAQNPRGRKRKKETPSFIGEKGGKHRGTKTTSGRGGRNCPGKKPKPKVENPNFPPQEQLTSRKSTPRRTGETLFTTLSKDQECRYFPM